MIKPMDVTPEVSRALAVLRALAANDPSGPLTRAVDTLDNAGLFSEIDEANDYATAEEILAESAALSLDEELGKLDPAEWGDVSRTDIARRAGLVPAERHVHDGCGLDCTR